MAASPNWTYEQTLIAFRVYLNTKYGQLNQSNPVIPAVAKLIGRTPSAVIMKCCNFAGLDPLHRARGVKGLANRSHYEKQVWAEFQEDSEALADRMETEWDRLTSEAQFPDIDDGAEPPLPGGPSEVKRLVRTRRVQRAFRSAVLIGYDNRCALTGLATPGLLNASHIIPWSENVKLRADPRNGVCLNALHDRAFDRGLISFDDDLKAIVSPTLKQRAELGDLAAVLTGIAGKPLQTPERFGPTTEALAYHRGHVFQVA